MDEFLTKMGGTLMGRPYVFAFLAAYIFVAGMQMGWRRAVAFIPAGYGIAWCSEKLSITTGFPYGWYFYRYENLANDWLVAGVPFFDSLSYVFLCYVGWSMAITLTMPLSREGRDVRWAGVPRVRRSLGVVMLGAFLTMLLDVVIDPIAHKGGEWFLGSIYNYGTAADPRPGEYFDIALTNFAGWFLVAFAIIAAYAAIDRAFSMWDEKRSAVPIRDVHGDRMWNAGLLGAGLFYGVLGFNLAVMIAVAVARANAGKIAGNDGAHTMLALFAISVAWHAPFVVSLVRRVQTAAP